ncbi:MAG: hypothetical protein AAF356_03730 [Planctomycetota bacterium]
MGQDVLLALEQRVELGQHERQQEDGHADGEHADHARIDRGADDHLAGLDLLGEIAGDAVEHLAEGAGHFGRANHVDVERAEELGVGLERFAELLAALDLAAHLVHDRLERGVGLLLGDALERHPQADAGTHHHRELAREIEHLGQARLALGDAGEEGLAPRRLFLDRRERDDVQALVAQHGRGGGDAVGGHDTAAGLSPAVADLITVLLTHGPFLSARVRRRAGARACRGARPGRSRPAC